MGFEKRTATCAQNGISQNAAGRSPAVWKLLRFTPNARSRQSFAAFAVTSAFAYSLSNDTHKRRIVLLAVWALRIIA